jgi:hypothetical protein
MACSFCAKSVSTLHVQQGSTLAERIDLGDGGGCLASKGAQFVEPSIDSLPIDRTDTWQGDVDLLEIVDRREVDLFSGVEIAKLRKLTGIQARLVHLDQAREPLIQ